MMSNEQYKLHPISAVINIVKGIKELIIPILIIVFTRFFNKSDEDINFWTQIFPILIIVVPTVLYLFSGILKWWTFRYWFEDGELRVKYGLFVKKKRYIPFERIQNFNHKESIFHRLFGLVEVTVETAGGSEVVLTAITKDSAKRVEIETRKAQEEKNNEQINEEGGIFEEVKVEPSSRVIHKMSTKDLLILATTSNSIGVVITGILAVYSQISEFIDVDFIIDELESLMKYGFIFIAFIIFLAFLIAWIISVVITFINNYNFTVSEQNDRLIITRGLLEKKRITIPLNRVQAIKIIENPIRQLFKLSTVVVESAGGGFEEKDLKMTLFPLISKGKMYEPLQKLFPEYEWETAIVRPSKKGRPFFYRKDFFWAIPVVVLCSYYFYPYGLLSTFGLILLLLFRLWQFNSTGIAISNNQLKIVYRLFNRVTFIAQKNKIQVVESKQSFFQKRKNVTSVQATVMSHLVGTTAKAAHLDDEVGKEVLEWFKRK